MSGWLDDQHRAIAKLGRTFDGELWMMAAHLEQPIDEIAFIVAIDSETVEQTSGHGPKTGIEFTGVDTPHGLVFVVWLCLFALSDQPHFFEVFLNPASDEGAEWLRLLARQQTVQLIFYDCRDGSPIGRRVLALGPELRESVMTVIELSKSPEVPSGSFRLAQEFALENLPPPLR